MHSPGTSSRHPFLSQRTRLRWFLPEYLGPGSGAQKPGRLHRRQLRPIATGSHGITGKKASVRALFSYLFSYCSLSELQQPSVKSIFKHFLFFKHWNSGNRLHLDFYIVYTRLNSIAGFSLTVRTQKWERTISPPDLRLNKNITRQNFC